jgi:acetoin utilization deacetylase AcuC-like enzyme
MAVAANQLLNRSLAHKILMIDLNVHQGNGPAKMPENIDEVFRMLSELSMPCSVAIGGGYSPDIRNIMEAHSNTYRVARNVYG